MWQGIPYAKAPIGNLRWKAPEDPEIWNNVFSQFNSKPGVERHNYKELPSKNIDTGAGLERWCCLFQNVDSNFETEAGKDNFSVSRGSDLDYYSRLHKSNKPDLKIGFNWKG